MPDRDTAQRLAADRRKGKSPSTQAGEFVRQEIHHIREGKHGVKNARQAIAIALSEARRAGVDIPDKRSSPSRRKKKSASSSSRKSAAPRKAAASTKRRSTESRARRSQAALKALRKQPRRGASHLALSREAHSVARKRTAAQRSASAKKAARTRARERSAR
jgi:hypothetical protein